MDPAATLRDLRQQALEAVEALGRLEPGEVDAAAVELIAEAERLKNSLCAVQAQAAVALKRARVEERAHQPKPMRERGIGTEVALARRESPHRGGIHLGLAVVLTEELPHTLAAMRAGWCTEWRATQIVQGTACLSLVDRLRIDAELMSEESTTAGWGERRFRAEVDRLAYVADPAAAVARHEKAVSERHTSIRPVADGMVRLSALLPLAKGVSVHATLSRCADSARADSGGDNGTAAPFVEEDRRGRTGRRARRKADRREARCGGGQLRSERLEGATHAARPVAERLNYLPGLCGDDLER